MDIIKVLHFQKSFEGKVVHRDVNFTVKKGECLGLLGGSGAGKSVILRSLIGLEKPDNGEIWVENTNIVPLREDQLSQVRKDVAYVFQYGALFDSMSVFDNIAYPLRDHTALTENEIAEKVHAILSDFNLDGCNNLMPNELSGGMQKRVGLARAIILDPKVVLYDEPTAGLDPANTIIIQKLINKLKSKGNTSILVTHDMDTAFAVCDRVYFLLDGEAIELDPVENLKKNRDQFLNYFMKGAV